MHIAALLPSKHHYSRGVMLAEIATALVFAGMLVGTIIFAHELIELSRVRAQVAQIARFDQAVSDFYEKYDALPGDILAASADREGLPNGNGTPAHGNDDGRISPCNIGWQWHLGCETALFWADLAAGGYIQENFTADSRLADKRMDTVGVMDPYLPRSPLADDVYIAVWNSDSEMPSPEPRLAYGNYYEISRITGIEDNEYIDDANAITPVQSHAIDAKIDDGYPLTGRVVVNGTANWPEDAWGTYAATGERSCATPSRRYNIKEYFKANRALCHLAIALNCCSKD